MKALFEEAEERAKDAEEIFINLLAYDPSIRSLCPKVPLKKIQRDISTIARRYAKLYGELGEKIDETKRI